ncbi:lactonase family protein [Flavitalea flava]
MKNFIPLKLMVAGLLIFMFVSCSKNGDKNAAGSQLKKPALTDMISENGANPDEVVMAGQGSATTAVTTTESETKNKRHKGHFLYSESNAWGMNQILVYEIKSDGSLQAGGQVVSGGAGTGAGLGSQGALVLDKEHEWLFAVNAGSNSVSSFKVHDDGSLTLAHTIHSGGVTPNSLSIHGEMLYVLNTGSDNIHGFWIGEGGTFDDIDGSTQSLSGKGVVAPQISFTPDGDWLVVTEKATNKISTFKVRDNGSVWPAVITASTGQTPFGFDFARENYMIVSNAAGGTPAAGSATSYRIGNEGMPQEINGTVPNQQGAPCWVAVTKFGRFAFITNTASNSISTYYVSPWGALYLVNGAAASTGNGPVDIVVAANNYFVYALTPKSNTIGQFKRTLFGGLAVMGAVSGVPGSATGLAVY